jgi:hypothetical protein
MMDRLREYYSDIYNHLAEQRAQYDLVYKLLEPMFKQYILEMPPQLTIDSSFAEDEIKKMDSQAFFPDDGMLQSSLHWTGTTPVKYAAENSVDCGAVMTVVIEQQQPQTQFEFIADNVTSSAEKDSSNTSDNFQLFTSVALSSPPRSPPCSSLHINSNAVETAVESVASQIPGQQPSPSFSPYKLDPRTAVKVDGMTFCLVMLDNYYRAIQNKCDAEYNERVRRHHDCAIATVQDILERRRSLLSFLAYNPEAEVRAVLIWC